MMDRLSTVYRGGRQQGARRLSRLQHHRGRRRHRPAFADGCRRPAQDHGPVHSGDRPRRPALVGTSRTHPDDLQPVEESRPFALRTVPQLSPASLRARRTDVSDALRALGDPARASRARSSPGRGSTATRPSRTSPRTSHRLTPDTRCCASAASAVQAPEDQARSLQELERVRQELQAKWGQNPQEWEEFPPSVDGEYLMLWPGQFATLVQKQHGVVVPSSMRQVDGSAELNITQGYSAPAPPAAQP